MPSDGPILVDCRGLRCPLPVLKMEKRLATLPRGARLTILATDPMARIDIPLFCRQHSHDCSVSDEDDILRFEITKGEPDKAPS